MMAEQNLFPWQHSVWQGLVERHQQQGLPHALLLSGASGTGKQAFAHQLAAFLLCHSVSNKTAQVPCGQCQSCQLLRAGSHPDLLLAKPEDKSRQIRIDSIRKVNEFLAQTPQISQSQVVILHPLDVLNGNAANALLKTLEEPAGQSYLLLLGERMGAVMPTIRSRCQILSLPSPASTEAAGWLSAQLAQPVDASLQKLALRLCHGAPLKALEYINSHQLDALQSWIEQLQHWTKGVAPLQTTVDSWNKLDFEMVINWWLMATSDLLKSLQGVASHHCLFSPSSYIGDDLAGRITNHSDTSHDVIEPVRSSLLALQQDIYQVHGGLRQGLSHFNQNLLTENWLLAWKSAFGD